MLGAVVGRVEIFPAVGRVATLPVEGRAATLPVEGRVVPVPVLGSVEGRATPEPEELQPLDSSVRAVPEAPRVLDARKRF